MTRLVAIASLLVLGLPAVSASAHPHVWVDVSLAFQFDAAGRVEAIRSHWRFDEDYSAYAVAGLDQDGDGTYTREELVPLVSDVSESLPEYDFFTAVAAGDRQVAFGPDPVLAASFDGRVLDLDLYLPLEAPVDPRRDAVEVATYDPTYYVALQLAEPDPVRLNGTVPSGCRSSIRAPEIEGGAPWLSDDAATDLQLARSYAMTYATRATVACH